MRLEASAVESVADGVEGVSWLLGIPMKKVCYFLTFRCTGGCGNERISGISFHQPANISVHVSKLSESRLDAIR